MKRSIIVTVAIALVAVAVFGGQALAEKPETVPSNQVIIDLLLSMNQTVTDIQTEAADIEGKLDDPASGLAEIKAEVAAIEETVNEMDAKLDGMVKMESYSGSVVVLSGNFTVPVEETYPEARHVSLTVSVFPLFGFDPNDYVTVFDESVTSFIGAPVLTIEEGGPYYATVEFVTTEWSIWAANSADTADGHWPVDYKYTVTYPG